ncbi:MAG: GNAT family N-acetyltransferase [Kiloniellaceae bacterium]
MRFQPFRGGQVKALRLGRERVYLRPPVQRDWREWAALRAESRDFLVPWEPAWAYDALTRGAFRRRLRTYRAEMRQGTSYSFLVFRRADDALLGGVTISNVRRGVAQSASLGYWIGVPYTRQGYMTEALGAVLDFAFGRLGLHRVEAACLPDNLASKALLVKAGFREEGFAREYLRISGHWQDHVLFGILRDDVLGPKDT